MATQTQSDSPLDRLSRESDFDHEIFEGLDLVSRELRGKTFFDCHFKQLSAAHVILRDCTFEDCRFESCDLTLAIVAGARFQDVAFRDCKLLGIEWSQVSGLAFAVGYDACVLSQGSFMDLHMKKVEILRCRAQETNFAGTNLTQAVFSGTDLQGARFVGTNLTSANLSTASNYRINPRDNTLKKTRFSIEAALALAESMGVVLPKS